MASTIDQRDGSRLANSSSPDERDQVTFALGTSLNSAAGLYPYSLVWSQALRLLQ